MKIKKLSSAGIQPAFATRHEGCDRSLPASALPVSRKVYLAVLALNYENVERTVGFEPTTFCLEGRHSSR